MDSTSPAKTRRYILRKRQFDGLGQWEWQWHVWITEFQLKTWNGNHSKHDVKGEDHDRTGQTWYDSI